MNDNEVKMAIGTSCVVGFALGQTLVRRRVKKNAHKMAGLLMKTYTHLGYLAGEPNTTPQQLMDVIDSDMKFIAIAMKA